MHTEGLSWSLVIRWCSGDLSLCPRFWLCRQYLWCFERWVVFATFTPGYSHGPLTGMYPVEQLQAFEQDRIVGLQEAGWTYWQIAIYVGHKVSVVCRCLQQWSVEHSHTLGFGGPHSIDACQDRHIVGAAVAARTASREEIWAHVAPAVSPMAIGNHVPAAGLRSHVPLARLPLTPRHHQARLLWCRESVD